MALVETRTITPTWTVDGRGYLLTPSGAKVARVHDGMILLWDKRIRAEVAFTLEDFFTVTHTDGVMSDDGQGQSV